jgi:hypothetical protein
MLVALGAVKGDLRSDQQGAHESPVGGRNLGFRSASFVKCNSRIEFRVYTGFRDVTYDVVQVCSTCPVWCMMPSRQ